MYQIQQPQPSQPRIRLCPACGKLTPTNVPQCLECGALTPEIIEQQFTNYFIHSVFYRKSPFSYIFFGINILIFILMIFAGGTTDPVVLQAFGAKQNFLIHAGQYWRVITPMFIHIGIIHLLFNNYALWVMGPQLESLYGSARFVTIYVFSGIIGCLASYFYSNGLGAGASGSLFGLFGVLAVFALKYKSEIPLSLSQTIKTRVYPLIFLNLLITFLMPQIDKAGHIGGLLAGAFAALVIPYARPGESKTQAIWITTQIISLLLVIISFIFVFIHYDGPSLSTSTLNLAENLGFGEGKGIANRYAEALNNAENSFNVTQSTLTKNQSNQLLLQELKLDNLEAQKKLKAAPRLDQTADILRNRFIELLLLQEQLISKNDLQQIEILQKQYIELDQQIHNWVETHGKDYGLIFTTEEKQKPK